MIDDLQVMELMMSRLCHDLVGPIGATVNGLELIEELGAAEAGDALVMIGESAREASRRLRVFRIAFGFAGTQADLSFDDARELARDLTRDDKLVLDWSIAPVTGPTKPGRRGIKLLLNLLLLAREALPRGGRMRVAVSPAPDGRLALEIAAAGLGAGLPEEIAHALDGTLADDRLDPRSVHGVFTRRLADAAGSTITRDSQQDRFTLSCVLPA
jgi:histidine phosphotransferase ChpT